MGLAIEDQRHDRLGKKKKSRARGHDKKIQDMIIEENVALYKTDNEAQRTCWCSSDLLRAFNTHSTQTHTHERDETHDASDGTIQRHDFDYLWCAAQE